MKPILVLKDSAEAIAIEARASIGKYCIEECKAYCCRSSHLILDEGQVDVVTQGKREEITGRKLLERIPDRRYSLDMGDHSQPCPSLGRDFRCRIHKDSRRPKTCGDFPLFLHGKSILLSQRCPAVKENLLFPYTKRLSMMGYNVVRSSVTLDSDFYKVVDGL